MAWKRIRIANAKNNYMALKTITDKRNISVNLLFPSKLKIFITKMGSRQTEPKIEQLHVLQTVIY